MHIFQTRFLLQPLYQRLIVVTALQLLATSAGSLSECAPFNHHLNHHIQGMGFFGLCVEFNVSHDNCFSMMETMQSLSKNTMIFNFPAKFTIIMVDLS